MWLKWFPWRFIVRKVARHQGFLDPLVVFSKLQNFAQPSDVLFPTELLRSGVVLHARGLMNSLAIQHNLDWIWPYWVERQFNPRDDAFVPRAFSITQINLTHRNWTAVGLPDCPAYPLVDPRGLVTPLYDGWSIDAWIVTGKNSAFIPSRLPEASQKLILDGNLAVETGLAQGPFQIDSRVEVVGTKENPFCQIHFKGKSSSSAWLVVSLRPYNPEGVSFIDHIELLDGDRGWRVNKKDFVCFSEIPERHVFSYYRRGDVYPRLFEDDKDRATYCKVGMASAAALFKLDPNAAREIVVQVPLLPAKEPPPGVQSFPSNPSWSEALEGQCRLEIPDKQFQFLYDAALKTLILHCPLEVYPGPDQSRLAAQSRRRARGNPWGISQP